MTIADVLEALRHGRRAIGLELNENYAAMARTRIIGDAPLLQVVEAPAEGGVWQEPLL